MREKAPSSCSGTSSWDSTPLRKDSNLNSFTTKPYKTQVSGKDGFVHESCISHMSSFSGQMCDEIWGQVSELSDRSKSQQELVAKIREVRSLVA